MYITVLVNVCMYMFKYVKLSLNCTFSYVYTIKPCKGSWSNKFNLIENLI